MEQTKREVLSDPTVTHQQALVERMTKPKSTKTIVIPGGKNLMDNLDEDNLQNAVWTWLRGCRYFTKAQLSFAKDPEDYVVNTTQIETFDPSGDNPAWTMRTEGKLHLARLVADAIKEYRHIVSIDIKPDGVYVNRDQKEEFSHESDDFEPYITFAPKRSRYA